MYKKLINRVKNQGLFSTVNYFLFTVVGEKLGIEIIMKYSNAVNTFDNIEDKNIKIYEKKSDIPFSYINELTQACGVRFSQSVARKLNSNEKLAIGVVDGHPASIAWLKELNKDNENEIFWLIHGCLTLPLYRGLKLYPRSIKKLSQFAFKSTQSDKKPIVLIEASIANKASLKGIIQCDFKKTGIVINFRDKTLFSSK